MTVKYYNEYDFKLAIATAGANGVGIAAAFDLLIVKEGY